MHRDLQKKGVRVRVGMEATGHARWFERFLAELNFELWVGDPKVQTGCTMKTPFHAAPSPSLEG